MTNTKLVMELEKLFKQEPFNLENTEIKIKASYGSIEVNPNEDYIDELEDQVYTLSQENDRLREKQDGIDDELNYYKDLLNDNDIEYTEY